LHTAGAANGLRKPTPTTPLRTGGDVPSLLDAGVDRLNRRRDAGQQRAARLG
jgi:hypothetical protein